MTPADIAKMIDHTLLKPEATEVEIDQLCDEAVEYGFGCVCIHPCHVHRAVKRLEGQRPVVGSVVGFPFGTNCSEIKKVETVRALDDGAGEIDMVIRLDAAMSGDFDIVKRDIEAVIGPCRAFSVPVIVKTIFETALLAEPVKIKLCQIADELGVDFVKTSTGLHPAGGARIEDVKLLYDHRGQCKVKAAGGIRDLAALKAMLAAGAERIGTSSGVTIIQQIPPQ